MAAISKKTSFGLLRTNPKLTTNIKLVVNSKDSLFLESIDATSKLENSIYKGFKVNSNNNYAFDVQRFYSQKNTLLDKADAYYIGENDESKDVQNRYSDQYDFRYCYGSYPKTSRIHEEEFAIFSPIWIEANNIPDYFVIFKIPGPVSFNLDDPSISNLIDDKEKDLVLDQLISDPSNFFENYIKNIEIIKTFDLTEKTNIGRYLRNHVNHPRFPEYSTYISFEKDNYSYWNGISYDLGGYAESAENIYEEFILKDKTITESDDFITSGFERHGIIHPNIINLEFLFDEEFEKVEFNRYFGLYVSEAQLGQFILSNDRLYEDKDAEPSQIPRPIKNSIGNPDNTEDQFQWNVHGIKIYPEISGTAGDAVPLSGRLLTFDEIQNPRLSYVKDTNGNFYSLNNSRDWSTLNGPTGGTLDSDYIRIKNQKVNWKNFSGFEGPVDSIPAQLTENYGRSGFSFKVITQPENGDEIRIDRVDWNDPLISGSIDAFSIKADNTIPAGTINGSLFSAKGTLKDIAKSISLSINNIEILMGEDQIFRSISIENEIIIFTRIPSETWNRIGVTLFSTNESPPFEIYNGDVMTDNISYQPSPIATSSTSTGWFYQSTLSGGNTFPKSRAIIDKELAPKLKSENESFVKTLNGFDKIQSFSLYLDEPIIGRQGEITGFKNIDKFQVINLRDPKECFVLGSLKKIGLYEYAKNSTGYLSIFPIKDFDFNFHSTYYNKNADGDTASMWDWYKSLGTTAYPNDPKFDYSSLGSEAKLQIDNIVGPTSEFSLIGFRPLLGEANEILDTEELVSNEYDRLKELDIPQLALDSKVVPFISKWVYDDGSTDVRENEYRLNANRTFGYSNFSPAFKEFNRNPKYFTHEWYYLQEYPPYMGLEEKMNSFSYFDEELYFPNILLPGVSGSTESWEDLTGGTGASANLMSVSENYFSEYFTRENIGAVRIPKEFRYSIFSNGSDVQHAETLFRGAKVLIKEKSNNTPINYNLESINYLPSNRYNGYKFSAILKFGDTGSQITVVKNDNYKCVTMVIEADLESELLQYNDSFGSEKRFIDRSSLYSLNHKVGFTGGTSFYSDKRLSGGIANWEDDGTDFIVIGGTSSYGIYPNFSEEISLNENGSYNNILVTDGTYTFEFSEVSEITASTFKCKEIISSTLSGGSISPNGTLSLFPSIYYTMWSGVYWLRDDYIQALKEDMFYKNGGYNAYRRLIDSISFASIAEKFNIGDPRIKYVNVSKEGEVSFDDYILELVETDYPRIATYSRSQPIQKKPIDLQNFSGILGYELVATDRIDISEIARYRGGYNPKFSDVFTFIDPEDLVDEGLDGKNTEFYLGHKGDLYPSFGKIQSLYYNKINTENPNIILRSTEIEEERSIYPSIDEIAIDYRDFFVFKSNWDPFYYRKYIKKDTFEDIIGTREPIEKRSFMASKILQIPNFVSIETFADGFVEIENLGTKDQIKNVDANIILTKKLVESNQVLEIDVFTDLELYNSLGEYGIIDTFEEFMDPLYSFGELNLKDDIQLYIKNNIVPRYYIDKINFFQKEIINKSESQIELGLGDADKFRSGYVKTTDFQVEFPQPNSLNFKLIYKVPSDKKVSVSFSLSLEKK